MALLITEEDAEHKLNHPSNIIVKHKLVGTHNTGKGRPAGLKNISVEIKALLGTLAIKDGNKSVEQAFNIPPSQVSKYKNGQTSVGKPDLKLREALESNVEVVREKVISKILKSIDAITDEKITEESLPILSKAAANLAGVYDRLGEKINPNGFNQQNQFVFFGVKPRSEHDYKVIEVEAVNS